MMRQPDVIELIGCLTSAGVTTWLDGGWGVDALLGGQTRPHEDLDLVISSTDIAAVRAALEPYGFAVAEDELPTRFGMADGRGRRIDFHPVSFDGEGGGVQILQDGRTFRYPPQGFAGVGRVGDRTVRCLTPEVQVLCHLGYEPDDTDRHDMRVLRDRFGLALPPPYIETA